MLGAFCKAPSTSENKQATTPLNEEQIITNIMEKRLMELSPKGMFSFLWITLAYFFLPSLLFSQSSTRYEYTAPKMGTEFRLVLYAPTKEIADKAAEAAFNRVDKLNAIFSDYDASSEVSRLSISAGTGQEVPVSKELWEVLLLAQEVAQKSKGAFDVTIGPVSKLWRRAIRQQAYPNLIQLEEAKEKVCYKHLQLNAKSHSVRLKKKDMRLDLGGIAKGYTVDEICKILQQYGIQTALIDGGGDIFGHGSPPDAAGWKVQMLSRQTRSLNLDYFDKETKNWSSQKEQEKVAYLTNQAIASSGNTYKYLDWKGQRYSHIINPKTGVGVMHNDIINIQASSCALADAIASTLTVLSPKKGKKFLKKFKNVTLW